MDETSWRENGKTVWMWAFVVKGVTLYKIAHSRGHEVPLEVLGPNPRELIFMTDGAPIIYSPKKPEIVLNNFVGFTY